MQDNPDQNTALSKYRVWFVLYMPTCLVITYSAWAGTHTECVISWANITGNVQLNIHSLTTGCDAQLLPVMQDAVAVWKALYAEERPPIVLVGHSMGGAVAVRTAATKVSDLPYTHTCHLQRHECTALQADPFKCSIC